MERIRRYVTVVCLALADSDWYDRQLRDNPIRPFDETAAPMLWRSRSPAAPTWPVHSLTDAEIAAAEPSRLPDPVTIPLGKATHTLPAQTVLFPADIVALRIIQENLGRRPIAWALTAGSEIKSLSPFVLQQGLVFALQPAPVDSAVPTVDRRRVFGQLFDIPTTDRLIWEAYRYSGLSYPDGARLDPTSRGIASDFAMPFAQLGGAYEALADTGRAVRNFQRAAELTPDPALRRSLAGRLRELSR